jgi:hypothetical protein
MGQERFEYCGFSLVSQDGPSSAPIFISIFKNERIQIKCVHLMTHPGLEIRVHSIFNPLMAQDTLNEGSG